MTTTRTTETVSTTATAQLVHTHINTPLGPLVAAASAQGLALLAYDEGRADALLTDAEARLDTTSTPATSELDEVAEQLAEYFAGRRRVFTIELDWRLVHPFARQVLGAVADVPYGGVTTYGALATTIGRAGAARAVGNALGSNPLVIVLPCHRVLRVGGNLGGYTTGVDKKRFLLDLEAAA